MYCVMRASVPSVYRRYDVPIQVGYDPILYKWKNHFNEMKGVGMATYERNKCTAFHGLMA